MHAVEFAHLGALVESVKAHCKKVMPMLMMILLPMLPFLSVIIESVAKRILVHVEYDEFVLFCALVVMTFKRVVLYVLLWALVADCAAEVCESVMQFEYFMHSANVVCELGHDNERVFANCECTRCCAIAHHELSQSNRLLKLLYSHKTSR